LDGASQRNLVSTLAASHPGLGTSRPSSADSHHRTSHHWSASPPRRLSPAPLPTRPVRSRGSSPARSPQRSTDADVRTGSNMASLQAVGGRFF
jgi:hypothetical protein